MNEEAIRDARSHIEKGTGLSDEAVRRICSALLVLAFPQPPASSPAAHLPICEVEGCYFTAEPNLRRCRAHEGGFVIAVLR